MPMLRAMRALLLAGLLLVLPSLAAAGTQYGNLFCEVLDEATTRSVNPTARRMHFAYCVDLATGDVLGALIRRKGATVCTETGSYDFSSQTFIRDGGTCPYPAVEKLQLPAGAK